MKLLYVGILSHLLAISWGPPAACQALDIDAILGKGLALLVGQKYESPRGVPEAFKQYAMADESNDDIGRATCEHIIRRSGYDYERHPVVSDDGYVTNLLRIINPLADSTKLKQPPVMLLQGGITSTQIWVWASSRQHHPEKYPREPGDRPITSWNRSLPFMLANFGYDVYLAPHRGSNDQNRGHININDKLKLSSKLGKAQQVAAGKLGVEGHHQQQQHEADEGEGDEVHRDKSRPSMAEIIKYWDFSFDELAAFELPRQIDKVLEVSGSEKLTLVPMSFSTISSLMALSLSPRHQRKIHNAVVLGPIINNKGTSRLMASFHNNLCKWLPAEVGTLLVTEILFSQAFRDIYLYLGLNKEMRYTILLNLLLSLSGPSPKYLTLLEPGVYGHILMPTSWKMIKQYCQIITAAKLQRYDHGLRNKKIYGQPAPPRYNTDDVDYNNWMVVSAENDVLSTPKSVDQYIGTVRTKPFEHIKIKRYSHLDLWAAFDNDVKVNLPILGFLENFQLSPSNGGEGGDRHHQSIARNLGVGNVTAVDTPGLEAKSAIEAHVTSA